MSCSLPGLSFICRVRNEEACLGRCLEALGWVTIPHEVIVVLDRCTDESEQIARRYAERDPAIRIATHTTPVSRAGLETLITPRASVHSLPSYVWWCYGHTRYGWTFNFAGDFVLSEGLTEFLNERLCEVRYAFPKQCDQVRPVGMTTGPTRIRIPAVSEGISNREFYLSNGVVGFDKHVFWEVPRWVATEDLEIDHPIHHASSLSNLKSYWREPPWFADVDTAEAAELRERLRRAVEILGPEPVGAARGSNPECDAYYRRVLEKRVELEAIGARFYE